MKLFLLSVLCVFVYAQTNFPDVYCVYTDFGPFDKKTIVQGASIDLQDGYVRQTSTIFNYVGSSGTFDGISTFNPETGIFYFVNDFADSYIYGAQMTYPYALQAPIFLEDSGIASLSFDRPLGNIIAADMVKQTGQKRLVVYPTEPASAVKIIELPTTINLGAGAVDSDSRQYYNMGFDLTTKHAELTITNLTSGVTSSPLPVQCGPFTKLWYDYTAPIFQSKLYGITEFMNVTLQYKITEIDVSNGACQDVNLPTEGAIITAASFAEREGTIFYSTVSQEGVYVSSLSVRDGSKYTVKLEGKDFPLADLAVAYRSNKAKLLKEAKK